MESIGVFEVLGIALLSSLFSVGGGNGPIAVIQDKWVQTGALDPSLFTWVIALSHVSPGPKAGFMSGVGFYIAGFPGALAAVIGIILPSVIGAVSAIFGMVYLKRVIDRVSISAGFIIAGMIGAAAWNTLTPLHLNLWEVVGVVVIAGLIGWRNVEPAYVVLGAAGVGLLWIVITP